MKFSQIEGNADVKNALVGMVDSGRVPHAILFHEEEGGGAFPICQAFLEYLYCKDRAQGDPCMVCPSCNKIEKLIHPDVHYIYPAASGAISEQYSKEFRALVSSNPSFTSMQLYDALGLEGKNSVISVAESRHLLDVLSLSALEGGYRSVVIYLPEKMNAESANRLLKIIEEPPLKTQFLLITHQPEKVLQTISSRCQRIRVRPGEQAVTDSFEGEEIFHDIMDSLLKKDLFSAIEAAEQLSSLPSRESAKTFCVGASELLRQVFLVQQGLSGTFTVSAKAAQWAQRCRKTFPRQGLEILNRARMLIDRNVNLKILFTDMVDRLMLQI